MRIKNSVLLGLAVSLVAVGVHAATCLAVDTTYRQSNCSPDACSYSYYVPAWITCGTSGAPTGKVCGTASAATLRTYATMFCTNGCVSGVCNCQNPEGPGISDGGLKANQLSVPGTDCAGT